MSDDSADDDEVDDDEIDGGEDNADAADTSDGTSLPDDSAYVCPHCGEEIVIPVDVSQGSSQAYVEDCPVCCAPNLIHVELEEDGESRVWAEAE